MKTSNISYNTVMDVTAIKAHHVFHGDSPVTKGTWVEKGDSVILITVYCGKVRRNVVVAKRSGVIVPCKKNLWIADKGVLQPL